MSEHAQLTVNQIRGPYVQLLTNLQGKDGRIWLQALNVFLRKGHPWLNKPEKYDSFTYINEYIEKMRGITLLPETHVAFTWKVMRNAGDDQKQIMFFLEFLGKDTGYGLFEFDSMVDLTEFISIVDDADWVNIEKLIRGGYTPDEAFLEVAVEKMFMSACLGVESDDEQLTLTWYLQLPTKSRREMSVETDVQVVQKCLKLNYSKLQGKPFL